MARQVLEMLSPDYWSGLLASARTPGKDPFIAATEVKQATDGLAELANGGGGWQAQVQQIKTRRPDIVAELGEAAIIAAAQPASRGVCRYCHGHALAKLNRWPVPIPDSAMVALLGPRCPNCLTVARDGVRTAVAASAAASPVKLRAPAVAKSFRHAPDSCQVCAISGLAVERAAQAGHSDPETVQAADPQLADLIRRQLMPHQPQRGPRPTALLKNRDGWHLRYGARR
jgi:hypothetical protein